MQGSKDEFVSVNKQEWVTRLASKMGVMKIMGKIEGREHVGLEGVMIEGKLRMKEVVMELVELEEVSNLLLKQH